MMGGSIFVYNSIFAENCNFANNKATYGGAININGGLKGYDIVKCNFTNNTASKNGGAIYSFNDEHLLNITSCIFDSNDANYGGALYCCGDLVVDGTEFNCNDAIYGSAICFDASSSSSVRGSGYTTTYIYKATVFYSDFLNNKAYGDGGAIYCRGGSDKISALNCIFRGNYADSYGGAIYNGSAVNCAFNDNYADSRGGAIYCGSAEDCIFVNNIANDGYGGAIYCGSAEDCVFANNSAWSGGAIYNGSAVNSNFTGNEYDAINVGSAVNCIFIGNGQAIYTGSARDCIFINNSASFGGALEDSSAVNCIFNSNHAEYKGGAMYGGSAVNCNFTGNSAGEEGDHIYETSCENCNFVNTVIVSSDVTKYYGGSQKGIVNLTGNNVPLANVDVEITLNGKTSTVKTDSKGHASVDLNLPVGEYDLTAVYDKVSTTSKITVKSTLTVSDASGTYLNSKVSATFLDANGKALASKQVTFKVGSKNYSPTTDAKGVATANVDLGVGNYDVIAVNPVNSEQKTFKLVISKAESAVSLASIQSNGVTTLTATLSPSATGNVIFNVNGKEQSVVVKSGKAVLTLDNLDAGNYTVTAFYNGDNNLNASTSNTVTFNVAEVYPILTAKAVTKTYGTSTKLAVYLKDNKGNAIANVYVKVVIGSAVKNIKTNANGQATLAISNAPGSYDAKISYETAQTTAKITVKKATPKITASKKTYKLSLKTKKYTITLKANGKAMKSTKVYIKVNKKTFAATTNSKGQATFKITNLNKKGTFSATVTYKATKCYNKATKTVKITTKK